jgi:AraC-like DNA-binding protein
MNLILSVFLFTIFSSLGFSSDTLVLNHSNISYGDYFLTTSKISIYKDSTFLETPVTISNKTFKSYLANQHDCFKSNNWIKFHVKNNANEIRKWTLVHADPHATHYKLFECINKDSLIIINEAGTGIPFHKRILPFHTFSNELVFKPNETKTIYAWYAPGAYYNFKFVFQSPRFAVNWEITEYTFIGVFYGFLAFALLYSIVMYFTMKKKIYGVYAFYIFSCILYFSHHNLLLFQHFYPNLPGLNAFSQHTKGMIFTIAFYFYFIHFNTNDTNISIPYLRYIQVLIALYVILSLIDSFIITSNAGFSFIFVPFLLMFFSAIKIYKNGFKPTARFLVGMLSLILGFIVYQLMEYNLIAANVFTVYILYFATVFEIFVFSSSMGLRFKYIEIERNDAFLRFQRLFKVYTNESRTLRSVFEKRSNELVQKYNKAKQDLMLLEREVEQLTETEAKTFLVGDDDQQKFMSQLISVIELHLSNPQLDRELICKEMGLSKSVLYRKLQEANGNSVNNFIRSIRLRKAMALLKTKEHTISEVAFLTGFNSASYFTKSFKMEYNCSPSEV